MAIARGRISMDSYYESLHSNGGSSSQSLDESVPDSHHSILSFKTTTLGCNYTSYLNSSMLSFEQVHPLEDYTNFAYSLEHRLGTDPNSLEMARANGSGDRAAKGHSNGGDEQFGWFYGETTSENVSHKRPYMGGEVQPSKKHCGNNKKGKNKTVATKVDPQSLAAKNRRERISERLKVLQDLVPNGTKVDLVTMLEKAISYVKFLQLQVKVLATDEFWPSQGKKAPDVAQVKEAIDAILSSHVNSTSK